MPPLSRDAIFAVLSGLTVLACDKASTPTPEPVGSGESAAKVAPSAAPAAAAPSAVGSGSVTAREVAPAAGKPAEKEKTCSPGGCAPGQCGANK
jgi:hypothetical protein